MKSGPSVSTLIKHGANIHATDNIGKTPLFYSEGLEDLSMLLQLGANVNAIDDTGKTRLFSKYHSRLVDCLEELRSEVLKLSLVGTQ